MLDPISVTLKVDCQTIELKRGDIIQFADGQHVALLALDHPGRVVNVMGRAEIWEPVISHCPIALNRPIGWIATGEMAWQRTILHRGDLVFGRVPAPQVLAIAFHQRVPDSPRIAR